MIMQPAPTLRDIAEQGDQRATLEALRNSLATAIDACDEPRDVAQLARQLQAVLTQLAALPVVKETEDIVSAFRQPRSPRRSGAARTKPASGQPRSQSRRSSG